jgi:hypothetical protein
MTTKETKPTEPTTEDAYRILAQERMNRKQACTQEFQQLMQELLQKHNCDMEIVQTNSSRTGTSYQIIFNPK